MEKPFERIKDIPDDAVLTLKEVAAMFDMGYRDAVKYANERAHHGKLPKSSRKGGRRLFLGKDVKEFAADENKVILDLTLYGPADPEAVQTEVEEFAQVLVRTSPGVVRYRIGRQEPKKVDEEGRGHGGFEGSSGGGEGA